MIDPDYKSMAEELAVGLFDREILRFGEFKLKSGRQSPIYYNQRPILSVDHSLEISPDRQKRIAGLAITGYARIIEQASPHDHLYGIPQAGTAIGALVAGQAGDSYLWGRVGKKEYGKHEAVEGNISEGETVLQLDDVVTNADSKIESAKILSEAGLETVGFVVMLDREEGGAQALEKAEHSFASYFRLSTLVPYLVENNRIGSTELDALQSYHEGLKDEGIMSTYQHNGQ